MTDLVKKRLKRRSFLAEISGVAFLVVVALCGLWWVSTPMQAAFLAMHDKDSPKSSSGGDRINHDKYNFDLGKPNQSSDDCTLSSLNPFGAPVSLTCMQAAASKSLHTSFINDREQELEVILTDAMAEFFDKRIESFGLFVHSVNLCMEREPFHAKQLCATLIDKFPEYVKLLTQSYEGGNAAAAIPLLETRLREISLEQRNDAGINVKDLQNANTASTAQLISSLKQLAVTDNAAAKLLEFIKSSGALQY